MPDKDDFDLMDFLPYLLNQAADVLSLQFQAIYRGKYGMLRTEWRVLFHLGRYGDLTATQICDRARLHKTKVSRAVTALEAKRYVTRRIVDSDRRQNTISLTRDGRRVFDDLNIEARKFDARIRQGLSADEAETLHRCLVQISGLSDR